MPMHAGGRYNKNSLQYILRERGYEGLRIVHRLDAVTSGLVVMAKNKEMARACSKAFEESNVKKIYWARVQGYPIYNDPIYGKNGDNSGVSLQNQGIALVSKSLQFPTLGLSFSLSDQLVLDTLRQ